MNELQRLKIGIDIEIKIPVYITDRHIHILLMGKSGTGKSTHILHWWEADHLWKNAKVLVDPSGFLAKDCYSISGGSYCSLDHPIPLNPMKAPYNENVISDIISESINQVITITSPANTPMTVKMRGILDSAVKYCLAHNRKSLLNVLDYIKNLSGNVETREGLISRLTFLLSDERMVNLFCGNDSVEWGELIAKKRTFILDCFGMGSEKMIFAGNIITNGIKSYFRYARPKEYLPLSLYIDECHNFINPSLFDILKEGRKYKLSCVLATQDFAMFNEKLTRVMLNVGNIVSYKLGHKEASLISKEINIPTSSLQFIEKYHVAYLTPKERGIAKAPRPVLFLRKDPPEKVVPKRTAKPSWFTLESYPTA